MSIEPGEKIQTVHKSKPSQIVFQTLFHRRVRLGEADLHHCLPVQITIRISDLLDELPLMLTVEDVSHVLGIGLAHAYEVAHRRDFPTITLGSRIIVPRDKFMEWIDEQAVKKSEIL